MEKLLGGGLLRVEEQCSQVIVVGCGLAVAVGRAKVMLGLIPEGRYSGLEGGKVWHGRALMWVELVMENLQPYPYEHAHKCTQS